MSAGAHGCTVRIGPIQSGCNPVESTLSTSSLNRITTTGEQLTSLTAADRAVLD